MSQKAAARLPSLGDGIHGYHGDAGFRKQLAKEIFAVDQFVAAGGVPVTAGSPKPGTTGPEKQKPRPRWPGLPVRLRLLLSQPRAE
jgi:hypothetical protein